MVFLGGKVHCLEGVCVEKISVYAQVYIVYIYMITAQNRQLDINYILDKRD